MRVEAKLFGPLRSHLPPNASGGKVVVEFNDDETVTVDRLAEKLGIAEIPCVAILNDQETHRAKQLQDGDVVSFFPPLAGG